MYIIHFYSIYFLCLNYSVFIGVSDREELKGNSRRNKAKKRIENDLNDYNEWMKKGGMHIVHDSLISL